MQNDWGPAYTKSNDDLWIWGWAAGQHGFILWGLIAIVVITLILLVWRAYRSGCTEFDSKRVQAIMADHYVEDDIKPEKAKQTSGSAGKRGEIVPGSAG